MDARRYIALEQAYKRSQEIGRLAEERVKDLEAALLDIRTRCENNRALLGGSWTEIIDKCNAVLDSSPNSEEVDCS